MRRRVTVHVHVLVLCVCLCVCLSVCLSVTTLAATSFVLTLEVRYMYVGGYYRIFLDFNLWIFDKTFPSKVMA